MIALMIHGFGEGELKGVQLPRRSISRPLACKAAREQWIFTRYPVALEANCQPGSNSLSNSWRPPRCAEDTCDSIVTSSSVR